MKWMRILMMMTITAAVALGGAGCDNKGGEGPAEKAGKGIDDAVKKTGDTLKDTAEKTEDAAKKAAEDVQKKVN